jgi:choline dehydrogenase-like flavoprotein
MDTTEQSRSFHHEKAPGMHDFVIIGSGVSGGRMADELTAGGASCLLLEAGKAFDRKRFPPNEYRASSSLFWGGGIEFSKDARLGFLRGKCLGGTSVVNQADLDRFDDVAWNAWRDQTGIEFFQVSQMAPYYDYLDASVAKGPIPIEHYNRNARLFTQAFDQCGYHWKPLIRSQDDCRHDRGSDCIVCLGGCPRDAKQSTLVQCIPNARARGMEVEIEFEVDHIEDKRDHVLIAGKQRGQEKIVKARRAVLAAGCFGNTRILKRSSDLACKLPALGKNFCCHPQFMTFGVYDEPVDAHKGPLQSVQAHDGKLRSLGVKLENVFAGPIATAMLLPGTGIDHLKLMRQYRYLTSIEYATMDEPLGTIHVTSSGKVIADKPLSAADKEKLQRGYNVTTELHHAAGAKQVLHCDQGFGLHLMGGCPMGQDGSQSVVNPDFEVHDHPNVLAADSSIFPRAPGLNPSWTIMALTVRASRHLLGKPDITPSSKEVVTS